MAKAYKDVCPCKDCLERKVGCHSICKKYNDWLKTGIEIEKKIPVNYTNYSLPNYSNRRKRK